MSVKASWHHHALVSRKPQLRCIHHDQFPLLELGSTLLLSDVKLAPTHGQQDVHTYSLYLFQSPLKYTWTPRAQREQNQRIAYWRILIIPSRKDLYPVGRILLCSINQAALNTMASAKPYKFSKSFNLIYASCTSLKGLFEDHLWLVVNWYWL
jgi:hypothetical protein